MDVEPHGHPGVEELLEDRRLGATDSDPAPAPRGPGRGSEQHFQGRRAKGRHFAEVNDQQWLPGVHPVVEGVLERRGDHAGRGEEVDGRDLVVMRGDDPHRGPGGTGTPTQDREALACVFGSELGQHAGPFGAVEGAQ
jgi:hypothetical protein